MSTKPKKPSVEEILQLFDAVKQQYDESGIFKQFDEDNRIYELDFKNDLLLPEEFKPEGIILPTARDIVDTCVDNTDIFNVRVWSGRKGESPKSGEEQDTLRKFGLGVLYRNNIEATISPLRVAAKHYWLHGLGVIKTVWDADRYISKPEKNEGESDEAYAERIDTWRSENSGSIPIVIKGINPKSVLLDPYHEGGTFIFEVQDELCLNVKGHFGEKWTNPESKKISEKVQHISFWTPYYRCELYDREPMLKGKVVEHKYGFLPYVVLDSGLGNMDDKGDIKKRYVGILRYIKDLLVSESRDYSIGDIILKKNAYPWGYIEGDNAMSVDKVSAKFGEYTPLPPGVKLVDVVPKMPPGDLLTWMNTAAGYLASHGAPPSSRGMGESGVRSGADRRLIIAQASMRYQYSNEAFKNAVAKALSNCARIMKNVVPGDIDVWARTPTDEFDIEIKKSDMKEPFTFYVEFAPTSEEDEYRRHDDLERLVKSGLTTVPWARRQMSNVDPKAMELEEEKEILKKSPMIAKILEQYAACKLMERLSKLSMAESAKSPPPEVPPGAEGQPPVGGQATQSQEPGRRMATTVPNLAAIGSAQEQQNQMKTMRSQTSMTNQGAGGGGNRR